MRFIPDAREALADLDELVSRSADDLDLAVIIGRMIDEGAPFLCAQVDGFGAEGANGNVVRYQLPEQLKSYLATVRARNFNSDKIEGSSSTTSHEDNSEMVLVPRHPTKEMIEAAWADALAEDARGVWEEMIKAWIQSTKGKSEAGSF